jgi:hypothetical protein
MRSGRRLVSGAESHSFNTCERQNGRNGSTNDPRPENALADMSWSPPSGRWAFRRRRRTGKLRLSVGRSIDHTLDRAGGLVPEAVRIHRPLALPHRRAERHQFLARSKPVPWNPYDVRDLGGLTGSCLCLPSAVLHYLQTFFVRRDPYVLRLR